MSEELRESFKAMTKASQDRRTQNRENSKRMLERENIPFSIHNNGAHLIVEGPECYIDFWPGTGKWVTRDGKKGFGVKSLLMYVVVGEQPRE